MHFREMTKEYIISSTDMIILGLHRKKLSTNDLIDVRPGTGK